ncbi:Non-canonical poly(A) RNA polymerase papd5 [Entomophthora muscae]|uniref:Non-canonical poly(A) RNA polymerase papd5 n=1 Tax=Entomophthora muscae TaxID=34485 RepID=A0ACC2U263_9FUNG|nr:Non-canonical poly(A) RNA polymerase papd5 [Entomophthora muscae]
MLPSGSSESLFSVDLNTPSPPSDSPIQETKPISTVSKKAIEKINTDKQDKVLASLKELKNKVKLLKYWFFPQDYPSTLTAYERLHNEVYRYAEYLSPSDTEIAVRRSLINTIEKAVLELWPDSTVENYGSFRTNTFLPLSDLDIAVLLPRVVVNARPYLQTLLTKLTETLRVSHAENRSSARVPIITLTESTSGLSLDLCINVTSGIESSLITKSYLSQYPIMRDLVIILKHYLALKGLNKPFRGGLGSYALTLLVVSFFQTSALALKAFKDSRNCLGKLLVGFLEHYGERFCADDCIISIKDGAVYPREQSVLNSKVQIKYGHGLVLLDPQDESVNVARSCFTFRKIQSEFQSAADSLKRWLEYYDLGCENKTLSNSILNLTLGASTTLHMHRRQLAASHRFLEPGRADNFFP